MVGSCAPERDRNRDPNDRIYSRCHISKQRERGQVSLATLSLQHRAFLTYMKAQGHRSFTTANYATLREMIPLGLLATSDPRDSNAAPTVTFTVPRPVWKAIHHPAWQASPLPASQPWDPTWIYDNLIRR